MKTLYLSELCHLPKPGTYFVIGVKAPDDDDDEDFDSSSSLEYLQDKYPTVEIERFPEVVNPRYIHSDYRNGHILQPAFVTFFVKDYNVYTWC